MTQSIDGLSTQAVRKPKPRSKPLLKKQGGADRHTLQQEKLYTWQKKTNKRLQTAGYEVIPGAAYDTQTNRLAEDHLTQTTTTHYLCYECGYHHAQRRRMGCIGPCSLNVAQQIVQYNYKKKHAMTTLELTHNAMLLTHNHTFILTDYFFCHNCFELTTRQPKTHATNFPTH